MARLCPALAICLALPSSSSFAQPKWAATGSMSTIRFSHSATLLENGKVLIAGGGDGSSANDFPTPSAELYDPASGTFSPTGAMQCQQIGYAAVRLADGRVLAAGGDGPGWPPPVPRSCGETGDPASA